MKTPSRRTVRLIFALYVVSGLAGGAFGVWAFFSNGTTRLTLIAGYGGCGAILLGATGWLAF